MKEYWIDSEGKAIAISDMSEEYILNCLRNITKLYGRVKLEEAETDKDHIIFGAWWTLNCADEYIEAFNKELEVRKRIKNKEYPAIIVTPSCDECIDCITCVSDKTCDKWELSPYSIFKYLNGTDLEVAKRGYFICNGIVHEV